ncbi:MAG: dTDP-glucose 4,6-dehydratase [Bacteriovoracaceae bacterium]|nr:dTDP-glucose 4,6-dehydratase [Bacteriovoracaceae bacterium]
MSRRNVLITGGAGFIGSNFVPYFLEKHSDVQVFNLDKLTYAGDLANLKEIEDQDRYTFIEGDICDLELVKNTFSEHQISDVIHFAAESHVDNSISGPEAFVKTNVNGTFNLLDAARNSWQNAPGDNKKTFSDSTFHHISTDEVYGTLGDTGYFSETTAYAPNSPYSASKASSDMLVRSFFHTYGLNVKITNCSNNYGPKQHKEKLIPTIIRSALSRNDIPVYGDGKNVRDWLFVQDHCEAINLIFEKGHYGETYCIGGECEKQNIEIVNTICDLLQELAPIEDGHYRDHIKFVKDRPGHDKRYAVDISKIKNELGWSPHENLNSGLRKTVEWYISK